MAEFNRYELFVLLNQPKPLWLSYIDLSGVDLRGVNLLKAILIGAEKVVFSFVWYNQRIGC